VAGAAESTRKSSIIAGGAAEPATIHVGVWQNVCCRPDGRRAAKPPAEQENILNRPSIHAGVFNLTLVPKKIGRKPALKPTPTGLLPSEAVRRMMQFDRDNDSGVPR